MKKRIGVVIAILLICVISLVIARNVVVKRAAQIGVRQVTGLGLSIDKIDIGVMKTLVGIKGLTLHNPSGYPEEVMVDIPEIYVDYNLGDILRKNIHLEEVKFNLKELVVIKNEKGELNLDALKTVQEAKKETGAEQEKSGAPATQQFQIDSMELKIGTVFFKDYSQGTPPKIREFKINIDERFENITDPQQIARVILIKALSNTTIASLTNFDLDSLTQGVGGILKGATGIASEAVGKTAQTAKDIGAKAAGTATDAAKDISEGVGSTLKGAGDRVKKILPFGN